MCRHRQAPCQGPRPDTVSTMTVVDDNYTGHVEPRTAARRTLPGASIVKVSVGPMDNNAYLVTCSQTGETLLIDAANDAADPARADRAVRPEAVADRDQPSASGPLAGPVRGGQGHGCADRGPRARRRPAAGEAGPDPGQRRHRRDRRAVLRRHPSPGPHPGIGGIGAGRRRPGNRGHPPVHRRLPVSRRGGQDVAGRRLREAARRRDQPGVRRLRRLDRRVSRATATTPRSAPSGHTSPSGKSAVGDRHRERRSLSSPGPAAGRASASRTRWAATGAPSTSPGARRSRVSLARRHDRRDRRTGDRGRRRGHRRRGRPRRRRADEGALRPGASRAGQARHPGQQRRDHPRRDDGPDAVLGRARQRHRHPRRRTCAAVMSPPSTRHR